MLTLFVLKSTKVLDLYQDWLNGLKPRLNDKLGFVGNGFRYTYPGDKEKDIKKIIKIIDSYEDKINGKKFIGWPLSYKFNGFSVHHKVIYDNKAFRVSNLDTHPNKIGHEKIMEFIYDRLG